ncbi:unnamed protein product [Camellia sinensis]
MDLNPGNEVMDVSADKCIEGSEANTKSFKQALLHLRFNENNNEIFFDCDVEDLSSDDGEDMIEDIAAEDSELNQNDQIPKVKIPHGLLKKIREPWKKCLIIRLLGKSIGYKVFVTKMKKIWGLQADFEALDIGHGFFIVMFDMMEV